MTALADIEGIGPVYRDKLEAGGIGSVEQLLEAGATASGREHLCESCGVSHNLILEWVNHADLYRVKGIGSEYADLLEEAGVDSVPELAQRNAENLCAKMVEINESKNLVRQMPSESTVQQWVAEAQSLPRVVMH
jgi:predicted flap endonuclease-1-like 5' DNA nuclease